MDALDFIKDLKEATKNQQDSGQTTIPIVGLNTYLSEIEQLIVGAKGKSAATQAKVERAAQQAQTRFENQIETLKLQSAESAAIITSVVGAGLSALKFAFVMNGVAAVSLLVFLGILLTSSNAGVPPFFLSSLSCALFAFIIGAGVAGVATGTRYVAHVFLARERKDQIAESDSDAIKPRYWGKGFKLLTIALGMLAFALFFYGGSQTYKSLRNERTVVISALPQVSENAPVRSSSRVSTSSPKQSSIIVHHLR